MYNNNNNNNNNNNSNNEITIISIIIIIIIIKKKGQKNQTRKILEANKMKALRKIVGKIKLDRKTPTVQASRQK